MLYVTKYILSSLLARDEKNHLENFYVKLNLSNEKWLISYSYNPNKSMSCNHLDALRTFLDLHSTTCEKILILGDFNVGIEEQNSNFFEITTFLQALWNSPHVTKIQIILLHVLIWFYLTHVETFGVLVL